jgi:hypothetical protein
MENAFYSPLSGSGFAETTFPLFGERKKNKIQYNFSGILRLRPQRNIRINLSPPTGDLGGEILEYGSVKNKDTANIRFKH